MPLFVRYTLQTEFWSLLTWNFHDDQSVNRLVITLIQIYIILKQLSYNSKSSIYVIHKGIITKKTLSSCHVTTSHNSNEGRWNRNEFIEARIRNSNRHLLRLAFRIIWNFPNVSQEHFERKNASSEIKRAYKKISLRAIITCLLHKSSARSCIFIPLIRSGGQGKRKH